MIIKHVPGCENIVTDLLSHQADYIPDRTVVPLSGQDTDMWKEVDTIVMDCFEALSWGHLVSEASCPN